MKTAVFPLFPQKNVLAPVLIISSPSLLLLQGMEHNPDVTEEQDVSHYVSRNLFQKKDPLFKIIRDETVGR